MNTSHPQTVSLFIQCLVDSHYPEVAEAVTQVFDDLNVPLSYPDGQTCCGQAAYNNGYTAAARKAALHFFKVFEGAEVIVCPSGSCTHTVRKHYPELFKDNPELKRRAEEIAAKTYEFSEYLIDVLGVEELSSSFPARVTCHDSCHLTRGLGVRKQPRQLLHMVAGLELLEMEESDQCCGFGGTFSVKFPEISSALVEDKVERIVCSGADYVVGSDMSCLMNIAGCLHRRKENIKVMHIAQILAARGEEG